MVTRSAAPAGVQRAVLADSLRGAVAAHARPAVTAQRALAGDLRAKVSITGPPDHDAMVRLIRAASVAERQAALGDGALMRDIGQRFDKAGATILASALLEGSKTWVNPANNDFFRFFVQGAGGPPSSPTATMNCWESIMYAAYLVGAVNATWIDRFYRTALATTPDPNVAIWALLGWTSSLPTYNPGAGRTPSEGDLVFYMSGGTYPGHVAIYVGGGQVISLWNQPNGVDSVQRIGIKDLSGTITYKAAPW